MKRRKSHSSFFHDIIVIIESRDYMKKIILLLLGILLITGCGNKEDELIMVTEAGFAPYEYYEGGEIVGVDVDIARMIAEKLGKKLIIKDVAFDSIINEVKTGKADFGAAGISYSEERAKQVDFTINYSTSKQVVIVRTNNMLNAFNELNNKKIAVQLGSVGDTYATKNYPNATIVRQKKYLAAIQDLIDRKDDAVIMDELPAQEILKNYSDITLMEGYLTSDSYGMIVKKGNNELLISINEVLKDLKENGQIDEYIINHMKD